MPALKTRGVDARGHLLLHQNADMGELFGQEAQDVVETDQPHEDPVGPRHGNAAEGAEPHQGESLLNGRRLGDRPGIRRHDLADPSSGRVFALRDRPDRQVAIGQDTDGLVGSIQDDQSTDLPFGQSLSSVLRVSSASARSTVRVQMRPTARHAPPFHTHCLYDDTTCPVAL